MTGKAILMNEGGWSCTNSAKVIFEDTPLRDVTGKLIGVKRKHFIEASDVYDVRGGFDRSKNVQVSLMDQNTAKHFECAITSEKQGNIRLNAVPSTDDGKLKEMITKIKQIGGN